MKTNVLLVDDSKLLRAANSHLLAKAGYEVLVASDGEEGLRLACENHPDLILLDMLLPKMAGQDVLRALKANPDTAKIPVVVVTGLSQKNEEKLRKDGAAAFLEKSVLELDKQGTSLIQIVGTVLRESGQGNT